MTDPEQLNAIVTIVSHFVVFALGVLAGMHR